MNRLLQGLIAGSVATAPMSLLMQILHRWPARERAALPPQQITEVVTSRVGIKKHFDEPQLQALTLLNHFGFGAAMGAVYSLFSSRVIGHPVLKGTVWGLTVWTLSYLGWLPAARVLPPATEQPRQRNFLMIAAHLVWGISTALFTEKFAPEKTS